MQARAPSPALPAILSAVEALLRREYTDPKPGGPPQKPWTLLVAVNSDALLTAGPFRDALAAAVVVKFQDTLRAAMIRLQVRTINSTRWSFVNMPSLCRVRHTHAIAVSIIPTCFHPHSLVS